MLFSQAARIPQLCLHFFQKLKYCSYYTLWVSQIKLWHYNVIINDVTYIYSGIFAFGKTKILITETYSENY